MMRWGAGRRRPFEPEHSNIRQRSLKRGEGFDRNGSRREPLKDDRRLANRLW